MSIDGAEQYQPERMVKIICEIGLKKSFIFFNSSFYLAVETKWRVKQGNKKACVLN